MTRTTRTGLTFVALAITLGVYASVQAAPAPKLTVTSHAPVTTQPVGAGTLQPATSASYFQPAVGTAFLQ